MRFWREAFATGLVFCLFQLSLVQSLNATIAPDPASIRQQVDQFGVGARVELTLSGGEKLRGSIQAIDSGNFLFVSNRRQPPRPITYGDVAGMKLTRHRYRASGQPDAAEVKRVVLALGLEKHIVVNATDGREFHGLIRAIEPGYFSVLPDQQTSPVQIAYSDVRHVEKNLSLGATIVLLVLIGAAVIVTAAVLATR